MRQSLGVIALILFVAGISFVLSAQDQQGGRPAEITPASTAAVPQPEKIVPANGAQTHEGTVDKAGSPTVNPTRPRLISNQRSTKSAQKANRR